MLSVLAKFSLKDGQVAFIHYIRSLQHQKARFSTQNERFALDPLAGVGTLYEGHQHRARSSYLAHV